MESSLEQAIKESWSEDTTFTPEEWSEDNPSRGQCVVSSMVLQDYNGGDLIEGIAIYPDGYETTHVWLRLLRNLRAGRYDWIPEYETIDLTLDQFPEDTRIIDSKPEDRDYWENNGWFNERYETLRDRVKEKLVNQR